MCYSFPVIEFQTQNMIRTSCPECFSEYRVVVEFAGRNAQCPKCGTVFEIPKPEVPAEELVATAEVPEILEGKDAFVPIPDWVQKPEFPIEAAN